MNRSNLIEAVSFLEDDVVFQSSDPSPQELTLLQIDFKIYEYRLAHSLDVRTIARTFSISNKPYPFA